MSEAEAELEGFEAALDWWAAGEPEPMPACPHEDLALYEAWERGFDEGWGK